MNLKVQRRLASAVLGVSVKRVVFDPASLPKIKEAITKQDVRSLINQGLIAAAPVKGVSRGRQRHRLAQKRKGRLKGAGSRKGRATARLATKDQWIARIRMQRRVLRELLAEKKLSHEHYRMLYMKAKGGTFRSRSHLMLYINEHKLLGGSP